MAYPHVLIANPKQVGLQRKFGSYLTQLHMLAIAANALAISNGRVARWNFPYTKELPCCCTSPAQTQGHLILLGLGPFSSNKSRADR